MTAVIRRTFYAACFGLLPLAAYAEIRTWTSADGAFKTDAEYVGMKAGEIVVIKRADGSIIDVPLNRLGAADQAYVRSQVPGAAVPKPAVTSSVTTGTTTPSTTPSNLNDAASLRNIEREAQAAKTAEEAVVLYTVFLSDPSLSPDVRKGADEKLNEWKQMADKGLVHLGSKWVTVEEARTARVKAVFLINQGLEMIRLNQDKLGFDKLSEASTVSPDDIMADFILGTTYALALHRYDKAEQHFKTCLRRDPNNPVILNNLALTQIRLRRPTDALANWRMAASLCHDERIVQNIGRLFELAGSRQINVPPAVIDQLSDIYASLVITNNVKAGENRSGWQYMVLPQEAPIDEQTAELPADPTVDSATMVCSSGIVVAPQYVLTTRTATKGLAGFLIADPNEKGRKLAAKLVASSKDSDLALLHCPEMKAPAAPLDFRPPRMDTDVLVAGYPQVDTMAAALKVARGFTRSPSVVSQAGLVVYEAPKSPSVTGGPVVDGMGNVVALHWKTLAALNNRYCAGIPIYKCESFIRTNVPNASFVKPSPADQPLDEVEKQLANYTVVVMAKAPAQDVGLNSRVGKGFLLDVSCGKCNGSKVMDCPARNCTNGKVGYESTVVTGVIPTTGDRITSTVKQYRACSTCNGRGKVSCNACRGSGVDTNISPTSVRNSTGSSTFPRP